MTERRNIGYCIALRAEFAAKCNGKIADEEAAGSWISRQNIDLACQNR
jgi:hypothetical protein